MRCYTPGILRVHAEALDILRKRTVTLRSGLGSIGHVDRKLRKVRSIESRVFRKCVESLCIAGEPSSKHRLMDEIHTKFKGVVAGRVAYVIAELIFLLVAHAGKCGDGG